MPTTIAAITGRHQRRRASTLTARERQDWQDVEALLAEIHQLRSLLTAVVEATPADATSPTVETARAYLAQPEPPTRGENGRRPPRREV
jgi:hypothetical protein